MTLTERDKRMLIRGMSLARSILKNGGTSEAILTYQEQMADAWNLPVGAFEADEFRTIVEQINDAIALKHPDWTNRDGKPWKVRQ